MDLGKLEKAAAEFERAVDVCTQDFSANLYRGMCAYQRKQYADAVQSFSIAIALAPGSAECYHDRALAYAAWGKNDHALHDYDRALALAPNLAAAALNRGILHYQEGRHAQARADLERALRAGADPGDTHFNLALVTLALHDEPAARQHLRSALSHNPAHPKALQLERQLRATH